VKVRDRTIRANAKLTPAGEANLPEQILTVATELFRWTPPTLARRTG
jgi:hypothetical protein